MSENPEMECRDVIADKQDSKDEKRAIKDVASLSKTAGNGGPT